MKWFLVKLLAIGLVDPSIDGVGPFDSQQNCLSQLVIEVPAVVNATDLSVVGFICMREDQMGKK